MADMTNRTTFRSVTEAKQAWEGFGPDDAEAPARSTSFEDFLGRDAAEGEALAKVTAAFGTVVEVRDGYEEVANGFGGTTTRRTDTAPRTPKGRDWRSEPATDAQKAKVRGMLAERAGTPGAERIRADLNKAREAGTLNKGMLSDAITDLAKVNPAMATPAAPEVPQEAPKTFRKRPNKYAGKCYLCGAHVAEGEGLLGKTDEGKWSVEHDGTCPTAFPFPEGRYAVENEEGILRFYHLTQGRVYVQASSEEHLIPEPAASAIVAKIAVDPEAASRTYGREIGACGRCGRVLTNDQSRAEGIGPICASKGF